MRIVVVGASLAGLRAAQALRAAGHEDEVVVIGDEARRPYTRPPLSKELLVGDHTAAAVRLPERRARRRVAPRRGRRRARSRGSRGRCWTAASGSPTTA